ncbi:MAG: hypothetical protein ACRYGG_21655, partial [Janthinobacterium lividum]
MVLKSCFKTLVWLGDLSRWREEKRTTGEPEWAHAVGFYDLAGYLKPQSGTPHHQLAVVADKSGAPSISIVYHFLRSLSSADLHPAAGVNLNLLYAKLVAASSKPGKTKPKAPAPGPNAALFVVAENLVALHAHITKDGSQATIDNLGNRYLVGLKAAVKDPFTETMFIRMVLTNMAAEWNGLRHHEREHTRLTSGSTQELTPLAAKAEKSNEAAGRKSHLNHQMVNANTFTLMLRSIEPDLQLLRAAPNLKLLPQADRLSPLLRRLIPSIRLQSAWLLYSVRALTTPTGNQTPLQRETGAAISDLWVAYAETLTTLIHVFSVAELPNQLGYLLPEDDDTLGFEPFRHSSVSSRLLDESGARLPRPAVEAVVRHPADVEMLARVRQILVDGVNLAGEEVSFHSPCFPTACFILPSHSSHHLRTISLTIIQATPMALTSIATGPVFTVPALLNSTPAPTAQSSASTTWPTPMLPPRLPPQTPVQPPPSTPHAPSSAWPGPVPPSAASTVYTGASAVEHVARYSFGDADGAEQARVAFWSVGNAGRRTPPGVTFE